MGCEEGPEGRGGGRETDGSAEVPGVGGDEGGNGPIGVGECRGTAMDGGGSRLPSANQK